MSFQWLDHALGEVFRKHIAEYLNGFGLEATTIAILVPVVGYLGLKLFRAFVGSMMPEPEPEWAHLNPEDETAMHDAFDNFHVIARLAITLGEPDAATFEEFRSQVRRLGLYAGLLR